ncbi:MAG TPA: hypothetical protein VJ697_16565 [Nitrososphaeraceae archaeon]|nr:hypothetical protein [Nitrososphaeraceae archaeon]
MDLRTIYGITSPQPNQYMIVVLHAESKFIRFTQKFDNKKVIVERLFVVARALRAIHNANYVYTELSEKSILLTDCNEVYLDVMNVCKSIDAENNQSSNVHSFGTILNKFLVKFNDERMLELIHKCLLNDERLRPSIYNVVNDLQNIHNSYDSD